MSLGMTFILQAGTDRRAEVRSTPQVKEQRQRVIARSAAGVSTFINEKTQKTYSVSTNENGNQRKNALVSTFKNVIS